MAILEEPIKGIVEVKNYIDGEWVESQGEIQDVVNPVNGEVIARVPLSLIGGELHRLLVPDASSV
jgi:hypothetical protein